MAEDWYRQMQITVSGGAVNVSSGDTGSNEKTCANDDSLDAPAPVIKELRKAEHLASDKFSDTVSYVSDSALLFGGNRWQKGVMQTLLKNFATPA